MKEIEKVPFDSMPPLIRGSFLTEEQEEKLKKPFKDVVLVVRCKDCRWWHESELEQFKGYGECGQANGIALKPHDWFCADGERKNNG